MEGEAFAPSAVVLSRDLLVMEVAPDALLKYLAGVYCGSAWLSTRDKTWKAWRPDRNGGWIQYGLNGRAAAVAYLVAPVAVSIDG